MRGLVPIVAVISILVIASTAVLYFQTRDAAEKILLSRALDRANTFSLAAKAANVDDGVLDYLTKSMMDDTVRFACAYAPDGKKLCTHDGTDIDPGFRKSRIDEVLGAGSFAFNKVEDKRGEPVFEMWFPLRTGSMAVPVGTEREFGPGPREERQRILLLRLDTASADQLVTQSLIHAVLVAVLLALLLVLTVRQQRHFLREQEMQRNLTEQRRFAELGRLSGVLAHEIRNPLGAIKGFAQYAREHFKDDDPHRGDMDTIVAESTRLERLVKSLLTYATPRKPDTKPCALAPFVNGVVCLIQHDAGEKKIEIETSLTSEELTAPIDEEQMTQAVLNILANAVEATEEGGRLVVSLEPGRGFVRIVIEDNGEGIPPEILPQIFEPYVTQKASGTGLGLSVTRRIVRAHGGSIEVERVETGGSRFIVVLPSEVSVAKR